MTDEIDRLIACVDDWQRAGHRLAVATVVGTWGSAPRRPGAMLLVRDDGLFEGSVSGGCVEGAVIAAAVRRMATGGGELLSFGVADEAAWDVGLACGGDIRVMVQAVDDSGFPPGLFARIKAARRAGEGLTLAWDFAGGATREEAHGDFVHRIEPPLRLLIVGAVHIAQALVTIASGLGYAVHLVDPRGAFGAADRFARLGVDLSVDPRWPDEALADWKPDRATAVVTLTHDPKLDDVALRAALASPAFYIGALGSRRTHAARLDRLRAAGIAEAALSRIRGPAGLAIGAATPAEIALAIAAEMVAAWRGAHAS